VAGGGGWGVGGGGVSGDEAEEGVGISVSGRWYASTGA
jgi:hypothetical protein